MAKNTEKTDAFGGLKVSPSTFGVGEKRPVQPQPVPVPPVAPKSLTKNISITLQTDAIEKLNALAEAQGVSRSKFINNWIMSL